MSGGLGASRGSCWSNLEKQVLQPPIGFWSLGVMPIGVAEREYHMQYGAPLVSYLFSSKVEVVSQIK